MVRRAIGTEKFNEIMRSKGASPLLEGGHTNAPGVPKMRTKPLADTVVDYTAVAGFFVGGSPSGGTASPFEGAVSGRGNGGNQKGGKAPFLRTTILLAKLCSELHICMYPPFALK